MFGKLIPRKKKSGSLAVRHEDHPIARLRDDFDQLWQRFWDDWDRGGLSLGNESRWFGPRFDFDDDEKEYVLRTALPGFEVDDFDIQISGNMLTLQAEHKEEGKEKNGTYRRYGSVYETFSLPQGACPDEIDARYHSGVLELHIPKSEDCQSKRIEVKPT